MKLLVSLSLVSICLLSCQQQSTPQKFNLTVNLSGDYPDQLQLKIGHKIYTSTIKNSQAIFSDTLSFSKSAQLLLNDSTSTTSFYIESTQSLNLLVDKVNIGKLYYLESDIQNLYPTKASKILGHLNDYQNGKLSEKVFINRFNRFRANHRKHQVNGHILYELAYGNKIGFKALEVLYNQTPTEAFAIADKESFLNYFEKRKKYQKGNPFFDFKLKNLDQSFITKNDLKGSLYFVEFWSTWQSEDALIQTEALLENYRQHKAKGFEIVSIALNTNKSEWLNYVLGKQMPWINTIAEQGFTSNITSEMGIVNLPQNYLVNSDGLIIAKNIDVAELKVYQNLIFKR